jgi:prophage DNA circulation protein
VSWETDLLDASFRGVPFDVQRTQDSAGRDIATSEYPFVDGGDIDDLGRKPRNLRLTAVFWGDDYERRLQQFLAVLDVAGSGELIHPVFGSMPSMQCTEYQAAHDADNPDACRLEIVFLESQPQIPFFNRQFPLSQADIIFGQVQTALSQAQAAIDDALAPLRTARKWMKKVKGLTATALGVVSVLRSDITGFVSTTTDFVHYPAAVMNDLQAAFRLIPLPSPGTAGLAGASALIMTGWTDIVTELTSVVTLPARLVTGATPAAVTIPAGTQVSDVTALTTALSVQAALQMASDAADILSDEASADPLSPDDTEQIVGDTRQAIQAAIDQVRLTFAAATQDVSAGTTAAGVTWQPVVSSLKDVALSLQTLGAAVIARRPPVTTRTVRTDGNLHLLAHLWYGDYRRAAELLRLNPSLRDPNDVRAGDRLHAFSR